MLKVDAKGRGGKPDRASQLCYQRAYCLVAQKLVNLIGFEHGKICEFTEFSSLSPSKLLLFKILVVELRIAMLFTELGFNDITKTEQ